MKTYFRTNLDDAKRLDWPDMDFPPLVGDIIQSVTPIGYSRSFNNCQSSIYIELEDWHLQKVSLIGTDIFPRIGII